MGCCALQIERFYTKRQILEMYMNYVFLGAGCITVSRPEPKTVFSESL
jgi:membrane peptidoglycan carboxypeptidase